MPQEGTSLWSSDKDGEEFGIDFKIRAFLIETLDTILGYSENFKYILVRDKKICIV